MQPLAVMALSALLAGLAGTCAASPGPTGLDPEATVRRVDRLAMLALTRAGDRLVAAGERGRILVSDDSGSSWRVAVSPTHHTLTSLFFASPKVGFATGHQGTLLRTEDGGLTWTAARIDMKQKPALFALRMRGENGIAVGAYGAYLETLDGGRTWQQRAIGPAEFDRHLTGIAMVGEGRAVLAGEAGTLLATLDGGATWQLLKPPYEGSFFGAIGLRSGGVIAFGMRGNAFRTADLGKTWQRIDLGAYKGALQGASELADGTVVLMGADGMIAASRDEGVTFAVNFLPSRTTVVALERTMGRSLSAGPSGLHWID